MENLVFEIAIIFAGSALLSTIFLYLKQPIILSYIAIGIILGPWGFGIIQDPQHLDYLSHLGIVLLMFLLGLDLEPQKLLSLLKITAPLTIITSLLYISFIFGIISFFQFPFIEKLIIGSCLMFSSTVVALKLVPTTTLHHKRLGEIMISILLFQDILAIILIILLYSNNESSLLIQSISLLGKLIIIAIGAFIFVKYAILKLLQKFDIVQEYVFVLVLGWSLFLAEIANLSGLSYEIGAFIGGISLGSSKIAQIIAEQLKPLREFFLVLFFFTIGARFDFITAKQVFIPGFIIAIGLLIIKPIIFSFSLRLIKENKSTSNEIGFRLGQASEFSLLAAVVAYKTAKISQQGHFLVQIVVIITFTISTYLVVYKYHTPISRLEK